MRLQRMWTMSVALCLAAGLAGYGDEPTVISDGPNPAKGSCHQLPKDGTSAYFTMDLIEERSQANSKPRRMTDPTKGSVTMSSVGQTTLDGEACRWIEVKVILKAEGAPVLEVWKVLISEKRLEAGKSPIESVVKGWHLHQFVPPAEDGIDLKSKPTIRKETPVTELAGLKDEDRRQGLIRLSCFAPWFCGPLKNAKKLDKALVDSGLGKLECEGISGETVFRFSKPETTQMHVSVEKRLHEKAPFGIVSTETRAWFEAKNVLGGVMKLKLMETSENTESELPKW